LFNQKGVLIGWKNNTTLEEKWADAKTSLNEDANNIVPKAFSGIQIIHASFFTALQLQGKFSLIDAYLQIAATNTIGYYDHSDSILMDVGKPENLEKAATLFP
jgi:NDP-sugar pyrophosphorylase family protein